jgi:hypothetical protein
MEILGYSERGLINSLFYEVKCSKKKFDLINNMLALIAFPYQKEKISFNITKAKILIEQSFSDFGDADAVLLIENNNRKQIIFIEAKVKNCQRTCWNISKEFNKFEKGINENKVSSSNLFVQLYHKVRLIKALQNGSLNNLTNGINFPKCSSKRIRKIGNNQVVIKSVNECLNYFEESFFIALIPENMSELKYFYNNTLRNYSPSGFHDWDTKNWGYISWGQIEDFCRSNKFIGTLKNFEWNKGQIY